MRIARVLFAVFVCVVTAGCGFSTGTKVDIVALDYSFDPANIPTDAHTFVCTIEDHAQRGMTGTLTVR